jgi:hypothetical protein
MLAYHGFDGKCELTNKLSAPLIIQQQRYATISTNIMPSTAVQILIILKNHLCHDVTFRLITCFCQGVVCLLASI